MSRRANYPLLLLVTVLAGCEAQKPSAATPLITNGRPPVRIEAAPDTRAAPATQPVTAVAAAVIVEEPGQTPGALASEAEAYAEAIEKQMSQRGVAKPPAPGAAQLAGSSARRAQPAEIQWLDQGAFRLSLEPSVQPVVQPVHAVDVGGISSLGLSAAPVAAAASTSALPATQPVRPDARPAPPAADALADGLSQRMRANPRDLSAHVEHQLLQFLRGQSVPQLDSIAGLPAEDREVVAALMDALSNFRTNARSAEGMLLSHKVRPLVELSERLRTRSGLRVPTAVLCTRVEGFGIYEPVEARFPAGRETRVILYCEVENFASRLNGKDLWETNLTLETVLYDAKGTRVSSEARRPVVDLSRNRRRDFFARGIIRIPAVPAGDYSMTVTIADQQANRMAETRVTVTVGAEGGVR